MTEKVGSCHGVAMWFLGCSGLFLGGLVNKNIPVPYKNVCAILSMSISNSLGSTITYNEPYNVPREHKYLVEDQSNLYKRK